MQDFVHQQYFGVPHDERIGPWSAQATPRLEDADFKKVAEEVSKDHRP